MKKITSRLAFRVTLPILMIWPILWLLLYFFVKNTAPEIYLAIGGVLSCAVLMIILIVYGSVHAPIRSITNRLGAGNKPDYKGVYEIEKLSTAINHAMTSSRQLTTNLEKMVRTRTRELAKAKEETESATRVKSDFLARISHEIRTPLNAIIGLTNLTLKTELTPTQKDYLSNVHLASRHLLNIINDILDISRIDADRLELSSGHISLSRLIEKVAGMFRNKVAKKQLELVFIIHKNVPGDLAGDSPRVEQIFINLIDNAIKFTDKGEIVVNIQSDFENSAGGIHASPVRLRCSVKDTGIGIPQNKINNLFQPFTQANGSLNRQHEGVGLGLSICQHLVEKMDGRLWIESVVGQGTTFYFTIVLNRHPNHMTPQLVPPPELDKLKVMILAEKAPCRLLMEKMVRGYGFAVTSAPSAVQGISVIVEVAEHDPFDLVLLERFVSGEDGFEVASRIKANNRILSVGKDTRIILMSSNAGDIAANDEKPGTVDSFLLKPISSYGLLAAILEAFNYHQSLENHADGNGADDRPVDIKKIAGARVLLVEDNEINRKFAESLLRMKGFEVDVAVNGREAVEQLKRSIGSSRSAVDAVLMDIEMPVMDGYTATRIIRNDPELKAIPIVAMTAHVLKGIKEKCMTAGMNGYVPKPIDEQQLLGALSNQLGGRIRSAPPPDALRRAREKNRWEAMPNQIPGIDLQQALNRLGGKTGLLRDLYKRFLEKYGDVHETIKRYISQGSMEEAKRLAHTIKGTSGTIGADALFAAAGELDHQLRNGCGNDLDAAMNTFLKCHHEVIESLERLNLDQPNNGTVSCQEGTAVDLDKVAPLLREMAVYLEKSDSRVRHIMTALETLLKGTYLSTEIEHLGRAVYRLDSEQALSCLTVIAERLQSTSGDDEESTNAV